MLQKIDDLYDYLAKREQRFGMNFGLERMEEMLKGLDVKHQQLKFVHLAGTNGKGSTLHYLKNILAAGGYRVATFTSPHIESVTERIMINDERISEQDFLRLFNRVMGYIESLEKKDIFPTQFEILTIIALMYFEEQKPDLVLMETGLGGRLDSTNVITSLISIITSISKDHTNILGDSISGIAFEKAGIIKENSYVITGVTDEEALTVIQNKAQEKHCVLYELDNHIHLEHLLSTDGGEEFSYSFQNHTFEKWMIPMLGKHQIQNASLAITAAILLNEKCGFQLKDEHIQGGLMQSKWKGRLETVSTKPHIIVDGSHNEAGIRALIETLQERYSHKKIIFVTAALADKDVSSMMGMLEQVAHHIICTQFTMDRALEAEKLVLSCKHTPSSYFESWEEAIDKGIQMMDENTLLVVTGSLYFLYYVRPYFLEKNQTELLS
ncbi:bifunctional folylpolyglutamate synthase/dihydrofolate synthase [Bacillus massiliigorillae]|uniref:bifunctional folylpolyglutamate synthase/dihydrofolate synthase n=1 Tax=Bacillus massiliigorillae TaxID=1243664 RepID=UPI0003A20A68|nr:folylpolyglutamate synthase/dihydrofolate synthase family protein [Bacillus massiliigorillae]